MTTTWVTHNNRNVFFHCPGGKRSKIKAPARLTPSGGLEGASVLCLSPSCWQCPPIFSVSWLVAPWLCDHLLPVCPWVSSRNFPVCVCVCVLCVSKLPLGCWITATAKSRQSCPTLCNPIDGSPPGSPIPGILQARILEWIAISFSNAWKWKMKVKSLSRVRLLATPWTAAYQAPPSMGFSRQEYWSGVPLPSRGVGLVPP